ncbi:MAG: hypothetical protein IKV54_01870 [Clostridia bacterium]|nr:hypothetical protein [Clostridia bacterium]
MKNRKKIISAILVVIMILGALVFVACGPAKKNLLKTMAPDDLLKYVYVTDAEEFAGKFTEGYEKFTSYKDAAANTQGSMIYEPSDELISYIEDDMMGGFKLGLDKLGFDIKTMQKSPTDIAYLLEFKVNDTPVADLDVYTADSGFIFASDVLFGGAYKDESYGSVDSINDLSSLPDTEVIKAFLPKIVETAITEVNGVTVTEGQAVNFGDVSQSAVALDAKITYATLEKIVNAVLAELRDNQDIKKILIDFYNANGATTGLEYEYDTADEFYAAYTEAIADAIESVKESAAEENADDTAFDFRTWIDDDYHIIAINVKNEDGELLAGASEDGDDKGYLVDFKQDGTPVFSFVGSIVKEKNSSSISFTLNSASTGLTVSDIGELVSEGKNLSISLKGSSATEKNIMNGSYTLSVNGEDYVKAELYDVNAKILNKENRFVGTVKISTLDAINDLLSEINVDPISCTVVSEDTKDVNKASLVLEFTHGYESIGKFYVTSEYSSAAPEYTVPSTSTEMPEPDLTALFDNLKKAGINENIIDLIETSINSSFNYNDEYIGEEYIGFEDEFYFGEDYDDIFSDM